MPAPGKWLFRCVAAGMVVSVFVVSIVFALAVSLDLLLRSLALTFPP